MFAKDFDTIYGMYLRLSVSNLVLVISNLWSLFFSIKQKQTNKQAKQ